MSERCERFEAERLLDIELGRPADEHFSTCPDCKEAERKRRAIISLLGQVGEDREPPAGWEDAIRARIVAAEKLRGKGRRRLRLAAIGFGIAAAAAIALWAARPRPRENALALQVTVVRGAEPVRGATPHPGDRLVVHVALGPRAPGRMELRVYRGEAELVARCSSEPPCRLGADSLDAEIVLPSPGSFRALLLSGAAPPPPAGLDRDASQMADAGGDALLSLPVEVY